MSWLETPASLHSSPITLTGLTRLTLERPFPVLESPKKCNIGKNSLNMGNLNSISDMGCY